MKATMAFPLFQAACVQSNRLRALPQTMVSDYIYTSEHCLLKLRDFLPVSLQSLDQNVFKININSTGLGYTMHHQPGLSGPCRYGPTS